MLPGDSLGFPFSLYILAFAAGAVAEVVLLLLGVCDASGWLDVLLICAPVAVVVGIRHPTFVLPFYFFIGTLKSLPLLQAFPGNLSVVMGLYVAVCCCVHLLRTRKHAISIPAMVIFTLLVAMIVVAYSRSVMPQIANVKMMYLRTFLAVSFVAPMILVVDRRAIEELLWGLILVGVLVLLGMFLGTERDAYIHARMGMSGASAITTANALALGVILSLFWWFPRARGLLARCAAAVVAAICMAGLIATGSRGPFLFALVTLGVGSLSYLRMLSRNFVNNGLRLMVIAACLFFLVWGLKASRYTEDFGGSERVLSVVNGDWRQVVRADDRYWLWKAAIEMIVDKPLLGHGLGAYNRKLSRGDEWDYTYPHNLVLDLGCEAGLPTALLLVALYVLAFVGVTVPLLVRPPEGWVGRSLTAVTLILLFSFLEAMVSNDVFKARYEWGALGLACAMAVVARRERPASAEDPDRVPG